MQRRGPENPQFQTMIADMAAIDRFFKRGHMTPPILPRDQADAIRAEYREAVIRVGERVIRLLTHPNVADVALQGKDSLDIPPARRQSSDDFRIGVKLARKRGIPNLVLTARDSVRSLPDKVEETTLSRDQQQQRYQKWADNHDARFKEGIRTGFPSSPENGWVFSRDEVTRHEGRFGPTYTYSSSSERLLEPLDLVEHFTLFESFIGGAGEVFRTVSERIGALSITEEEAERLRRITEAGNQASQIMADALRTPPVTVEEKPILSHWDRIVSEDTQRAEKARTSDAFFRLQAKFATLDVSNGFAHDALTFGDIVDIVDLYLKAHNVASPQALQVLDRLAQVNMQKVEPRYHRVVLGELAILRNVKSIDQLHRNNPLYTIPIDLDNTGDTDFNRFLEFDHLAGFGLVHRDEGYYIRLAGNNPSIGYPRIDPVAAAIFQEADLPLRE